MDDVMKVISEWNEYGDENFTRPTVHGFLLRFIEPTDRL